MPPRRRVVIVGGGFGGLHAARALRRVPVQVTLIDRRNFHLFQPLLYQVATGGLSPANIASPLRSVLRRQTNADVLLGEVAGFDLPQRQVLLKEGSIPFDWLIVAAGSRPSYFGQDHWESIAPGLKTVEDATEIRSRIMRAFESAERQAETAPVARRLTFVVIGGGPTGVELAGTIAELARHTLRYDFRHIDPAKARVVLLEGRERVLPLYPPRLSAKAQAALERLGVEVRTQTMVTEMRPNHLTLRHGDKMETIDAQAVFWAAGVQASSLGQSLADATGAPVDSAGRICVESDCHVANEETVFVVGDLAHFNHDSGGPLPGVAPVAVQQGRYVANLIRLRLRGRAMPPFRYRDLGSMATIGRSSAVADIGPAHFAGLFAWLAWLFIHLMNLVGFENRLLVLVQWGWNYVTRNRSARLITGDRERTR